MEQYKNLVERVLANGTLTPNRTGVDTIKVTGEMLKVNLKNGFPVLTCKKTQYKAAIAETFGFFRSYSNAADFRAIGVKVWDKNANDPGKEGHRNAWLDNPYRLGEDDLGGIYGVQWRNWPGFKVVSIRSPICKKLEAEGWNILTTIYDDECSHVYYKAIDMLAECVRKIIETPTDRRIIFHAWNPAELDTMALPPCHLLYQFFPNTVTNEMEMCLYIRSNDIGLGLPFNLVGAATILSTIARITGYAPSWLTVFIGDAHVYVNQLDYLNELMSKEPLALPELLFSKNVPSVNEFKEGENRDRLTKAMYWLNKIEPVDLQVLNYQHHTLVTPVPEMAV